MFLTQTVLPGAGASLARQHRENASSEGTESPGRGAERVPQPWVAPGRIPRVPLGSEGASCSQGPGMDGGCRRQHCRAPGAEPEPQLCPGLKPSSEIRAAPGDVTPWDPERPKITHPVLSPSGAEPGPARGAEGTKPAVSPGQSRAPVSQVTEGPKLEPPPPGGARERSSSEAIRALRVNELLAHLVSAVPGAATFQN